MFESRTDRNLVSENPNLLWCFSATCSNILEGQIKHTRDFTKVHVFCQSVSPLMNFCHSPHFQGVWLLGNWQKSVIYLLWVLMTESLNDWVICEINTFPGRWTLETIWRKQTEGDLEVKSTLQPRGGLEQQQALGQQLQLCSSDSPSNECEETGEMFLFIIHFKWLSQWCRRQFQHKQYKDNIDYFPWFAFFIRMPLKKGRKILLEFIYLFIYSLILELRPDLVGGVCIVPMILGAQ